MLNGLNSKDALPSSIENIGPNEELTGHLAVTALLFRFQEVIKQFIKDEHRAGKCPLARCELLSAYFTASNSFCNLIIFITQAQTVRNFIRIESNCDVDFFAEKGIR